MLYFLGGIGLIGITRKENASDLQIKIHPSAGRQTLIYLKQFKSSNVGNWLRRRSCRRGVEGFEPNLPNASLLSSGTAAHKRPTLCRRSLELKFRALLGFSPAREIRRVQINRAVELLRLSNLPIGEVAERAGFTSAEYMASVFRKFFGARFRGCGSSRGWVLQA